MIILILGASHTGKTILAQRLLEKLNYPYLSIDLLKMGLIRSGQTSLTPFDDEALRQLLWPIVREMIRTALENGQNLIVEGCYIPFDWPKDFSLKELNSIRCLCLVQSHEWLMNHFDEVQCHARDIEKRIADDFILEEALAQNEEVLQQAKANNLPVLFIQDTYDQVVRQAIDLLKDPV